MAASSRSHRFFGGCSCCTEPAPVNAMGVDRRSLLAGALASLALGATAASEVRTAVAQPAAPAKPHRIDIHHHFSPPQWKDYVKGKELLQPANVNWTPEKSIEDMDKGGVAAAMISITN